MSCVCTRLPLFKLEIDKNFSIVQNGIEFGLKCISMDLLTQKCKRSLEKERTDGKEYIHKFGDSYCYII